MAGSGLDDQEPLVPSVKYISYRPANLRNTKNAGGVDVTESGVSTNETSKHKDKNIVWVEDGGGAPDAVATKSLDISVGGLGGVGGLENVFKIAEIDVVSGKSLDVLVGDLGGISKIGEMDTVAAKSSDISVGSLRGVESLEGATKSAIMVIKR